MNEAHQRFNAWLNAGAEGDPPRDVAVHASLCAACQRSIDALDTLASVNTGLAAMPAEPTGREHSRLAMTIRLAGATAVLFSAAILGVGLSQLISVSHRGSGVAQASPTPEQNVLGGTSTGQPSAEATPPPAETPQETLTPLGTPIPVRPPPVVTPIPWHSAAPTPAASIAPSSTPIQSAVPSDTPVPTAIPTDTPSASPTPTPADTPSPTPTETPSPTPTV